MVGIGTCNGSSGGSNVTTQTAVKGIIKASSRHLRTVVMHAEHDIRRSLNVAVIGAGAAGLVATRELKREGHSVTTFEQSDQAGGVWVYSEEVETEDLAGTDSSRKRVHGSLYRSLRTNLPRHIMAYTDFPFQLQASGKDTRLFPGHEEVLNYLQQFDRTFQISQDTRFGTQVSSVTPVQRSTKLSSKSNDPAHFLDHEWHVRSKDLAKDTTSDEVYDAVVVCNGHYSDARSPNIPGAEHFPGRLMHSHNYRENSGFEGLRVVVMGASASGQDISRDIACVAEKVFFSARSMQFGKKRIDWETSEEPIGDRRNVYKRQSIKALQADGSVLFDDDVAEKSIDVVVFATGYYFSFPFLHEAGIITTTDNRVDPLYQHVFCSTHPSLSFIGLPWQVIPFPLMELQSKWVAAILSGRATLPSRGEMQAQTEAFYRERESEGVPVRYTHRLGEGQWEYNAWLAKQVGLQTSILPEWRPQMHQVGRENISKRPESYRDTFPNSALVELAERSASQIVAH